MINRRLLSLAGHVWWPIAGCALMSYIVTGTWIAQAVLVAHGMNALVDNDRSRLLLCLGAAAGVVLLRAGFMIARQALTVALGMRARRHLRGMLVKKVADLGPAFMSGQRAGVVRSTLIEGVDGLDPYYSGYLPQLLVTATVPPVLLIWMANLSPWSALAVAVCIIIAFVVPQRFDSKLLDAGRQRWAAYADLSADYLESMQQMETLRSLGATQRRQLALDGRTWGLYRSTMSSLKISLVSTGFIALGTQAGVALAAVLAVERFGADPGMASTLFLVLMLAAECFRPVQELAKAWHAGYLGITAADGLDAILRPVPPVPDEGHKEMRWTDVAPPTIAVTSVSYIYPGADSPAVQLDDLIVHSGEAVALVGPSGCGKTTIQRLITRTLDPTTGTVTFDGTDLRDIPLARVRETVGVVSQDCFLFSGTVARNIALGTPEGEGIDEVRVRRAAKDAGLPLDLLDVELSDNGSRLSGGQRQRVAVARALYRGTPVLIFDEATSHLDESTARHISHTIAGLRGSHTIVVVTHGTAELAAVDRVIDLAALNTASLNAAVTEV
ncbi:ATP-binding cassette domain-containing protein [Corynebacterium sp. 4HC-13]|uniref:ABC transporter ATP-binding protein/permease n=1 Tax=Corynebacterium anserum TaxID=2684406 RepID=UPI00163A0734|nr:ATP-binding cassette domain-containing protein [Corynebacterium anserum]MBC2682222.1 ATP-binding cassette domain-containing protein [Corynebacterium anserum]